MFTGKVHRIETNGCHNTFRSERDTGSTSHWQALHGCWSEPAMVVEGIGLHLKIYLTPWGGGPGVVVSTAAFHARVRGSVPGLGGLKETKLFLPHPRVKVSIVGSLRDREVACSASDRQGANFESCVWRTVSSQSSHHHQEVLLAQFSLYVHKGGLKPDSFHLLDSLVFPITISWTFRILAQEENQYSYIYKILGQFFV